jgi:hypothetical protein
MLLARLTPLLCGTSLLPVRKGGLHCPLALDSRPGCSPSCGCCKKRAKSGLLPLPPLWLLLLLLLVLAAAGAVNAPGWVLLGGCS